MWLTIAMGTVQCLNHGNHSSLQAAIANAVKPPENTPETNTTMPPTFPRAIINTVPIIQNRAASNPVRIIHRRAASSHIVELLHLALDFTYRLFGNKSCGDER